MTEYQITSWRDLPAMVTARDGEAIAKEALSARFQEAIDEAAMRLGESGSEAYLAGWVRTPWEPAQGTPDEVCTRVCAELETTWDDAGLETYLDGITATP